MENNFRVLFLDTRPIRRGAQVFVHELKSRFKDDGIAVKRVFLYKESNYENLILDETDVVLPFQDYNIYENFIQLFFPHLFSEWSVPGRYHCSHSLMACNNRTFSSCTHCAPCALLPMLATHSG